MTTDYNPNLTGPNRPIRLSDEDALSDEEFHAQFKRPTVKERAAKRMARYTQLKKMDKADLLQRLNGLRRIHGLTLADTKLDILTAVLDIEHPMPKDWTPS